MDLEPCITDAMRHALPLAEFDRLRACLRGKLTADTAAGAQLNPSTALGAFSGVLEGREDDFLWAEPWSMFLRRAAFDELTREGICFSEVGYPQVRTAGGASIDLVEPVALPAIPFALQGLAPPVVPACALCGRQRGRFLEFLVTPETTMPRGADLCRGLNVVGPYIASHHFVNAARRLELTGFEAMPLRQVERA